MILMYPSPFHHVGATSTAASFPGEFAGAHIGAGEDGSTWNVRGSLPAYTGHLSLHSNPRVGHRAPSCCLVGEGGPCTARGCFTWNPQMARQRVPRLPPRADTRWVVATCGYPASASAAESSKMFHVEPSDGSPTEPTAATASRHPVGRCDLWISGKRAPQPHHRRCFTWNLRMAR
jgi:hypothetical protein